MALEAAGAVCERPHDTEQIEPTRLIVGISGASGAIYGVRLLEVLAARPDIETHLVISRAARLIIPQETDRTVAQVEALAEYVYSPDDIAAPIASGSFGGGGNLPHGVGGMVIVPCSMKTLSAIAHSHAADLMSRAADVTLKEGRSLVLVVRETPLHLGHLRLMVQAAEIGAVIFPPVPAFYGRPQSLPEVIDGTVGRLLARLGIANELYVRWKEEGERPMTNGRGSRTSYTCDGREKG